MFAIGLQGALSIGGKFGADFSNLDFPEIMNSRGFPKVSVNLKEIVGDVCGIG